MTLGQNFSVQTYVHLWVSLPGHPSRPAFWPNPWDGQQGLECCQRPISTPTGTYLRTLRMLIRLSTLCTPHSRSQGFCSRELPGVPSYASLLAKPFFRVCHVMPAFGPNPWEGQSRLCAVSGQFGLPLVHISAPLGCSIVCLRSVYHILVPKGFARLRLTRTLRHVHIWSRS